MSLAAGLVASACAPLPAPERATYITGNGAPPSGPGPRAGLLLPLSGEQAPLGQALLDAARQALGEMEPGPLVLVPQDSAPGAGLAARRAVELGCGLLVGPVGAADARAVADAAQRPTLALSNDTSIARDGLWPFGIDPETQAARAAAFAVAMGRTRLGALVPDDGYGARLVHGLEQALALRPGAVLTATVTHPADGRLPNGLAGRLAQAEAVLVGAGGSVPNAAARALGVGPNGQRLLGTLQWLSEPDPTGAPSPAGAWIAIPDPTTGAGFAKRYQDLFRQPASRLDFLVADAVGVAGTVGRSGGFPLTLLTRPEGFAGRLGAFRLGPTGRVERLLAVAESGQDGALGVVDPAPTGFAAPGIAGG